MVHSCMYHLSPPLDGQNSAKNCPRSVTNLNIGKGDTLGVSPLPIFKFHFFHEVITVVL